MIDPRRRHLPTRPDDPRRVRHGLKLKADEAALRGSGAHGRWIELIERLVPADALAEGLADARAGQVISLDVGAGSIVAMVQGRAVRPHEVSWRFEPFPAEAWNQLVGAMSLEAMDAAKLMGGDLPPSIDAVLKSMNLELVPGAGEVEVGCGCGLQSPCRHAAAAGWLFAERWLADPALILAARGLPLARLVDRVQAARALLTCGVSTAHGEALIPQRGGALPPLEHCLDDFWRPGAALHELEHSPPLQHASHALLRRLGPSPLGGRFPLVGLLASIYDTVSKSAIDLRDQAERIEDSTPDGSPRSA